MTRELGIRRFNGYGLRLRKHFLVRHGTVVRKHAGASARAEMESAGVSGVSGHTHRLGIFRRTTYGPPLTWAEGGCLCGVSPTYVLGQADRQQGATIAHLSTRGQGVLLQEVVGHAGKLWYGGRAY